jgi:hypothetical protein
MKDTSHNHTGADKINSDTLGMKMDVNEIDSKKK